MAGTNQSNRGIGTAAPQTPASTDTVLVSTGLQWFDEPHDLVACYRADNYDPGQLSTSTNVAMTIIATIIKPVDASRESAALLMFALKPKKKLEFYREYAAREGDVEWRDGRTR